jgi:hypothetical protein
VKEKNSLKTTPHTHFIYFIFPLPQITNYQFLKIANLHALTLDRLSNHSSQRSATHLIHRLLFFSAPQTFGIVVAQTGVPQFFIKRRRTFGAFGNATTHSHFDDRVTTANATEVIVVAMRADGTGFVMLFAARGASTGAQGLVHFLVHGDLQDPITDFFSFVVV